VFLLLAALYESWRLPWAVLLGSPLVALGAFFGTWLMGYDLNVYIQIGLVMLIGLAAKNAILIVEFAKAKHEEGMTLDEAALTSAKLRFRPILMTAFAFILGVVPLMRASGAGAGAQNVMGTGVFWGMLAATFLGVFIIPGNYTFIEGLGRKNKKVKDVSDEPTPPPSVVDDDVNGYDTIPQADITADISSHGPVGATSDNGVHKDANEKKKNAPAEASAEKGQKS
jgi:predicted RND superfamily exporter protein